MSYNYDNNFDMYDDKKEQDKLFADVKSLDKGYNVIYRNMSGRNGKMKRTKVGIYTSGSIHSHIRDAETGVYYTSRVGTHDEDLYFKVVLATGECKSKNGSKTLFYLSPRHYMAHLNCEVDDNTITQWQIKHDARVRTKEKSCKKYDITN